MGNRLYKSVISKLSNYYPLFDSSMMDGTLKDLGTDPNHVSASQMFLALSKVMPAVAETFTDDQIMLGVGCGVICRDPDMNILYMNATARDILGFRPSQSVEELTPKVAPPIEFNDETVRACEFTTDEGRVVQAIHAAARDRNGLRLGFVTVIQDITFVAELIDEAFNLYAKVDDLYKQEQEDRRRAALILKTVLNANSSLILEDVLTSAAVSIADAVGLPYCGIYLIDENSGLCEIRGRTGRLVDPAVLKALSETPLPLDYPLIKKATATGETLIIPDAKSTELIDDELREKIKLKSLLAIPLTVREKILGLAMVPSFDRRIDFEPDRVELADGIAKAVALAVDNAQLFQRSQALAAMEERNRLAQEIHDGLAQRLTGIIFQLEAASSLIELDSQQARERVERAVELARLSLDEARRSVWNLRPKSLEEKSLSEAIREEINRLVSDIDLETSFKIAGKEVKLSENVENGLLRIAQEALGNIRRHSRAQRVKVKLGFRKNKVTLIINDDGVGFKTKILPDGPGRGLSGMSKRAADMGGKFTLETLAGKGTRMSVEVPIRNFWR